MKIRITIWWKVLEKDHVYIKRFESIYRERFYKTSYKILPSSIDTSNTILIGTKARRAKEIGARCRMPTGLNLVTGVELTNYPLIICHRRERSWIDPTRRQVNFDEEG